MHILSPVTDNCSSWITRRVWENACRNDFMINLPESIVAKLGLDHALQKHSYSNILRILPPKNENLQLKNSGSFHISSQSIDCGYLLELPQRGSSNEYPQSMFLSRNKKINVYPCKPQFYCIKVGFKWGQNYIGMFS